MYLFIVHLDAISLYAIRYIIYQKGGDFILYRDDIISTISAIGVELALLLAIFSTTHYSGYADSLAIIHECISYDVMSESADALNNIPEPPELAEDAEGLVEISPLSCGYGSCKTYENYKMIRREGSYSYHLQQIAETDTNTGVRYIEVDGIKYYMIAVGSGWGLAIGDMCKVDLQQDDGTINTFFAMLGDGKSDNHTDATRKVGTNSGDVIEFIVDVDQLPEFMSGRGNLDYINIFNGSVIQITKVSEYCEI